MNMKSFRERLAWGRSLLRKCRYFVIDLFRPRRTSRKENIAKMAGRRYLCKVSQKGAGLGHAMASYNHGLKLSLKYGLTFVHYPLHDLGHGLGNRCDAFLGLPYDNIQYSDLPVSFKECSIRDPGSLSVIEENRTLDTIFKLEGEVSGLADGEYGETAGWFRKRYARARKEHRISTPFEHENVNIAVSIRRGDLLPQQKASTAGEKRLLPDWYYAKVINSVVQALGSRKKIVAHIYTDLPKGPYLNEEGDVSDFSKLIHCDSVVQTGYDPLVSFHHLVSADILITSRSGFSHLAAILSENIKIVAPFWHSYEGTNDVISTNMVWKDQKIQEADINASFDAEFFKQQWKLREKAREASS